MFLVCFDGLSIPLIMISVQPEICWPDFFNHHLPRRFCCHCFLEKCLLRYGDRWTPSKQYGCANATRQQPQARYGNSIATFNGYDKDAFTYVPIVIVGAGESGIAMGCRLKEKLGFDQFRIYDRQAGAGMSTPYGFKPAVMRLD